MAGAASCFSLANPKSSSFVPDLVSMMLPGFRSRWVMPLRCALSSASAISMANCSTWSIGSAPFSRRCASVSPSRYSITRKSMSVLMAGVVERADVRMIQAGDGLCFALEALAQFGAARKMRGQNLNSDDAVEARVAGFVHLAHAARTDCGEDFIGP